MITESDVRSALEKTLKDSRVKDWSLDYNFLADDLDSLDHATFALVLDERHGLKIPDEDLEKLESIRAVLDYVSRNKA